MAVNRIEINPSVLVWAREGMALSQEALASACSVPTGRVEAWELGEERPTYRQLVKASKKLLRDPAFFVRDEPPSTPTPVASFRRVWGARPAPPSYQLLKSLEVARGRREDYLDLVAARDEEPPTFPRGAQTSVREAAEQLREALNVSFARQEALTSEYQNLRMWITAIEDVGALVFHASYVSLDEFRGLAEDHPTTPLILLNGADAPPARCFTLLHELVHLWLGENDLARQTLEGPIGAGTKTTEGFCNQVAAELLMPRELIPGTVVSDIRDVRTAARRLNVSVYAMAYRLHSLDLTPGSIVNVARHAATKAEKSTNTDGSGNYYRTQLRNVGYRYAETVMEALFAGDISRSSAAGMLGTRQAAGIEKMHEALSARG